MRDFNHVISYDVKTQRVGNLKFEIITTGREAATVHIYIYLQFPVNMIYASKGKHKANNGSNSRKRQHKTKQVTANQLAGYCDSSNSAEGKIFKDPIHGSITLNQVLVSIIDTVQFQRLRFIKQLGACYWVYPGACHNRFEHSIGTSYLCGKMIRQLKKNHPELVTDMDVLCVEIAGLCHDLGHGPFSHVFDGNYKRLIAPDSHWSHEQGSIDMFDFMYQENKQLQEIFREAGITQKELQLVKDLILGKDPKTDEISEICTHQGKKMKKWFLYEIVSNKRNGIDCDKFDYLMRDSYYVGARNNFDCMRYFQTIRIIPVDGQLQICVRDKEYLNLYEMFHMRWSLHHRVYQHKITKIVEAMICEALEHVDQTFNIFGSISDMASYTYLTDSIINEISRSNSLEPGVEEAKHIINCIHKRQLYKFCGQVNAENITDDSLTSSAEILQKGEKKIAEEIAEMKNELKSDDFIVQIVKISFGMKDHDPVNSVIFFNKEGKPKRIRREHISSLLPEKFHEKYIRVYCKDFSKRNLIEASFQSWSRSNGFGFPDFLDGDTSGYFTDVHKDPAAIFERSYDRRENLEKNAKVRRSIFDES